MARLIAFGGFYQTGEVWKVEITAQNVYGDVLSEFQGESMNQFSIIAGRRTVNARNQFFECMLMFGKTMSKVCDTF